MKTWALLFLLAGSLAGSPLMLTNAQSSTDNTVSIGLGHFGGLSFGEQEVCAGFGAGCQDRPSPAIEILLRVGGRSFLSSSDVLQVINATASVDFSAPGYLVTIASLHALAQSDGTPYAVTNVWMTAPCTADIGGDSNQLDARCGTGGVSSGTITVHVGMSADALNQGRHGTGVVDDVNVVLALIPVAVPEPGYGALLVLLIASSLAYRGNGIRSPAGARSSSSARA